MLGDHRDCEQALGAADAQFGQIQPGDPAIELFSPTQPGRLAGSCYLFLHDAKTAVAILDGQPAHCGQKILRPLHRTDEMASDDLVFLVGTAGHEPGTP